MCFQKAYTILDRLKAEVMCDLIFSTDETRIAGVHRQCFHSDAISALRIFWMANLQGFLYAAFIVVYIIVLVGNFHIILVTSMDTAFQKSMYFFLAIFFLSRNLLCISYSPKDSVLHWDAVPNYFFDALCHTTVLLPYFWKYWMFSVDWDVLRPLHVHM